MAGEARSKGRRWAWTATALALLLMPGLAGASAARLPTFVRTWGSLGTGTGQFDNPIGIGVDSAGNVYVSDSLNDRVQKFSRDGTYITSWGGTGNGNGQFHEPWGIAVDASDNIYVGDGSNNRVQKFTSAGVYVTKWAVAAPLDVAVDGAGNVYVVSAANDRVEKYDGSGNFITQWGATGSGNSQFNHPYGIAVDNAGSVYVADSGNNRVQKFSSSGTFLTTWGSTGSGSGQFSAPYGIEADAAGNIYVADAFNYRIQKFSATGTFRGAWGSYGSGDGEFDQAYGVGVSPFGSIYVADTVNDRVQQFSQARMVVGLGDGGAGWAEDMGTMAPHGLRAWRLTSWAAYNAAHGATRPAFCDVDGDRKDELVLGLGPGGGGWLEVKDDADAGFASLAWIQVNWSGYNSANGETFPACGDIDGDGRDEIVVGLGTGGAGWTRLFDDAGTGFAPMPGTPTAGGWIRLPWTAYNAADGSVHPAVGNLDGDARDEIVFGLGAGSSAWVHIRDDQVAGFANLAGTPGGGGWLQLGWSAYTGATWPAVGDLDGDGGRYLVLGLDSGGAGWLRVFDASAGFAPAAGTPIAGGWVRINWSAYDAAVGSAFPAVGDLDGDGDGELIVGLGTYTSAGGYLEIFDSLADGLGHRAWPRVPWSGYNGGNGLTRPAVSH